MKKFRLSMLAMAGIMMGFTSCSEKEIDVTTDGDAVVSFSLGVDDVLGSRAASTLGNGTAVNQLYYTVFDENGAEVIQAKKSVDVASFPTTVSISLAKGQTYKVAFWAQSKDCAAYTVDDKMNVTMDYAAVDNNSDKYDAFFKTQDVTVTGNASVGVELKRPFAQVNVGVTADDWAAAVASNITVTTSTVDFGKVPNKLNVVDGEVSGSADLAYAATALPAGDLMVDTDGDGEKEAFHYLSMSYVLAPAAKTTLEKSAFTFKPAAGNDIVFAEGLTNVPVQRNYRTNIVGQILSGTVDFKIAVDAEFDGEHNVVYAKTAEDVNNLIAAGEDVIALAADITLPQILATSDVEFELNGKTLTIQDLNANATDVTYSFKNGDVVIEKSTARPNSTAGLAPMAANTTIVMENVNLVTTSQYDAIHGTQNIDNCHFVLKNSTVKAMYYGLSSNATIKDNTTGSSTWELEGCTIIGGETGMMFNVGDEFTAKNCKFEGTNYQAAILRCNTSEFEGCTFVLNLSATYGDYAIKTPGEIWSSGNNSPAACIVLGTKVAENGPYRGSTECTLKNCKFEIKGEKATYNGHADLLKANVPVIVLGKHGNAAYTTTLNIDAASKASLEAAGGAGISNVDNLCTVNDI